MMQTSPRLSTDTCALDDEHALPETVVVYSDEDVFWMGREHARVFCSEDEADIYTDELVFALHG